MSSVGTAIDASYQAHIASLYKVFSQAVLAAQGNANEVAAAEARFKAGLDHAADVQARALAITGLD